MANSPRFGIPLMSNATEQQWSVHSNAMKVVDVYLNATIIDQLATPPGSPTDGDTYLVIATATGAWVGQEGNLAYYINTVWEFYPPTPGLIVWDVAASQYIRWDGAAWVNTLNQTTFGFFYPGTPEIDELMNLIVVAEGLWLPPDLPTSRGRVIVNPTAAFDITLQKNGTPVGTVSISTGGVFTFDTSATAITLAPGDYLEFAAPNPADATIEGIALTLRGLRTS